MKDGEDAPRQPGPEGDGGALGLTPADIGALAETAREYVVRAVGVELDETPETLPVLDHYAGLVRGSARERPELLPLVAVPIAAYFGELVCSRLNAFWHATGEAPEQWMICGRAVVLAFSPLGIVLDVLYRGTEHQGPTGELVLLPEHREAVARRLALLPEVREDEYFMLATRFEVLELVAEEISRVMRGESDQRVWLEWEDYATLLAAPGGVA